MKKFVYVFLIIALFIAVPASAKSKVRVGDRIIVHPPDKTFPQNTPFHIAHGWYWTKGDEPRIPKGTLGFNLELDGKKVNRDFVEINETAGTIVWVNNFPEGMTGTHTFTGEWVAPCWVGVELGLIPECKNPNKPVVILTDSVTVEFNE